MRILMVHNYYQQQGGEDIVFAGETQMLREHGHDVFEFTAHNDDLKSMSLPRVAINMMWSSEMKNAIATKIADVQPDLVHFHNTFMSISPSAYYACKEAGLPVVQTLHNYRLLCPKATLHRDNGICTECIQNRTFLPAIRHGCYRDSRLHTVGVATMLNFHRLINTWTDQVDRYICLTEAGRQIFIEGGIAPEKLVVKGNFLMHDPGQSDRDAQYFVYMGRLTQEKGIKTLLDAWTMLPDIPLKIVGDGALRNEIETTIHRRNLTNIELTGQLPRKDAIDILKKATAQIVPSEWEEPFGLVAIEAFACGKPVIASKIGALADIVEHNTTGLHFTSQSPESLAEQVRIMVDDDDARRSMAIAARRDFEMKHTEQVNYHHLMRIYSDLLVSQTA